MHLHLHCTYPEANELLKSHGSLIMPSVPVTCWNVASSSTIGCSHNSIGGRWLACTSLHDVTPMHSSSQHMHGKSGAGMCTSLAAATAWTAGGCPAYRRMTSPPCMHLRPSACMYTSLTAATVALAAGGCPATHCRVSLPCMPLMPSVLQVKHMQEPTVTLLGTSDLNTLILGCCTIGPWIGRRTQL